MEQNAPNINTDAPKDIQQTLDSILCSFIRNNPNPQTQTEHQEIVNHLYRKISSVCDESIRVEKTYGWVDIHDFTNNVHKEKYPDYVPVKNKYGAHLWITVWVNTIPWVVDPNTPHPDYNNGALTLCVSDRSLYNETHPTSDVDHPYQTDN